jgi:hypothetical protein
MKNLIFAKIGVFALAATPAAAANVRQAPPGDPYKKVSDLVESPEFMPGMSTLYVDPREANQPQGAGQ